LNHHRYDKQISGDVLLRKNSRRRRSRKTEISGGVGGKGFGITSNTGCERCRESDLMRLKLEQGKFPEEEEKMVNT